MTDASSSRGAYLPLRFRCSKSALRTISRLCIIALAVVCVISTAQAADDGGATSPELVIDTGTTAWMLTSTALVLLMVPGLAMFYAGLVRTKNVVGTMMHSFAAMAVVGVVWTIVGYAVSDAGSDLGLAGEDRGRDVGRTAGGNGAYVGQGLDQLGDRAVSRVGRNMRDDRICNDKIRKLHRVTPVQCLVHFLHLSLSVRYLKHFVT